MLQINLIRDIKDGLVKLKNKTRESMGTISKKRQTTFWYYLFEQLD